ncbi:MAG: hypothetical protein ABI824_11955, partial [Acidobacteriota bacterium]
SRSTLTGMRTLSLIACVSMLVLGSGLAEAQAPTQQPILYHRGTINAASLAPFGLPNASIARGSIFTTFGENLGPAQGQQVNTFPLQTTFANVSMTVTQGTTTTAAIPIYVSATQINAVMPSTVTAGLATLRVTYQTRKSNAITIQIADASPGIFTVAGGAGPGVIQNFISGNNQPVNDSGPPAYRGQVITIWGTGLGSVPFPDTVAPTKGNVSTPVSVTIGGQTAIVGYSGRSPCCSGLDQIVVTIPNTAPLGCWVPVLVTAGGVVSNATTMAIAATGADFCSEPGNPLSSLVLTPGIQAFIHIGQVDTVENVNTPQPVTKVLQQFYSRFSVRLDEPFAFDPYLSYPPAGTCNVHQTSGDASLGKTLRGATPPSAANSPDMIYNNGTQSIPISSVVLPTVATLGGVFNGWQSGMNPASTGASLTVYPGPLQVVVPVVPVPAPSWNRPNAIIIVPRDAPLSVDFTPGDTAAPTAILLYAYAASTNSTVEVQCLAAPGVTTFTIPSESLANLPLSYRRIDGSYAELIIGTLGVNKLVSFTFLPATRSSGVLLNSSWVSQSVVIQ